MGLAEALREGEVRLEIVVGAEVVAVHSQVVEETSEAPLVAVLVPGEVGFEGEDEPMAWCMIQKYEHRNLKRQSFCYGVQASFYWSIMELSGNHHRV